LRPRNYVKNISRNKAKSQASRGVESPGVGDPNADPRLIMLNFLDKMSEFLHI